MLPQKKKPTRCSFLFFIFIALISSIIAVNAQDDAYEENDTINSPYDLRNAEQTWLSDINGIGRQFDPDWYRIEVSPGFERVTIFCTFLHTVGDIDLALYDSLGNVVASGFSSTDNEIIDLVVDESGEYFIRVYFGDIGNRYDLWWDDRNDFSSDIDLIDIGTTGPPINFYPDRFESFSTTIRNTGSVASGEGRVTLYLSEDNNITTDDYFLTFVSFPEIEPGSMEDLTFNFAVESDLDFGTYTLGYIIDSGNQIHETNKNNNIISFTAPRVFQAPTIDLVSERARAIGQRRCVPEKI